METARASRPATRLALRHYFGQIWRHRWVAIPALILIGVGNIFVAYVPPLVVAAALDRFQDTPVKLNALVPYLLWFSLAWFTGELLWRATFLLMARAELRAMRDLYVSGLTELSKKDISFFHDNFAGSLTKKAVGYGRNFETFFDTLAFNISANILPLFFVGFILWRFSPWLIIVLVGLLTLVILLIVPIIQRRKRLVDMREVASNKMAGHVADVIGNMDAVQAFANQPHEQQRHIRNTDDFIQKSLKTWDYHTLRVDMTISPFYVLINTLGLALAVLLSPDGVTRSAIFITFTYYTSATRILWEFNRTYRNLESSIAEAAQFTELLLKPSAIQDQAQPEPFKVTRGEVTFRDVDFAYRKGGKLFTKLDLQIEAGEKIALVGHSGGGKSTITKLLLRFVDVTDGELLIDGQNISRVRLRDLRRSIAYVPQEPAMFHRSIRENIRYGKLNADDAEVIAAAKKANAHDFITKLPEGYETLVGERGVKLSGGQRQRIAIARAIIKDAPILVLDEATSALDSESEKLIQTALRQLMESRTAIVIAHRLSTIQKMDRIIVLEEGKIAEQGTHAELLQHKGIYAKLWAHQSGGFIEN